MNATGLPSRSASTYSAEVRESGCCSGKLYRYMTPSYFEHGPTSAASWRSIRTAFEEQTTAHGIPNFSRARGTFKRCFWILVMLTMLAALVYNVRGLVVTYLRYDVSVSISVTQQQQFVFPAVTICNLSPVKKSALASSPIQLRRKRALSSDSENGTEAPAYCSNGWRLYNGSCYYFSSETVDQPTSILRCRSKSAQLTSINDQYELDFMTNVLSSFGTREYWIGLVKTVAWNSPTSFWLDGSTSQFRPWGPTEPNDNTTCVRLDLSVFRDRDCSLLFNYICKMRQGTTTQYPSTTVTTKAKKTTTQKPSTAAKMTTSTPTTTVETTELLAVETTATKTITTTATPTTKATVQTTTTTVASSAEATSTTMSTVPVITSSTAKVISTTMATTPEITSSTVKATSTIPTTAEITSSIFKAISTTMPATLEITSTTFRASSTIPTTAEITSSIFKAISTTMPATLEITSTTFRASSTIPTTPEITSPTAETTSTMMPTTFEITPPEEIATARQGTRESTSEFKQSDSTTSNPDTDPATVISLTTSAIRTNPQSADSTSSRASTVISPTISRPATTIASTKSPGTSSLELLQTSFETTDFDEATTSTPESFPTGFLSSTNPEVIPAAVRCCCRCCQWDADISAEFCAFCVNDTMDLSVSCASNREPPTPPTVGVSFNFEAPPTISGSRFPDRPAYRDDFLKQNSLTEDLASMPDDEKSILGFSITDLIVDCHFDGTPCDLTRDFTEFYSNIYGNCFVFNSGWANFTEQTRMSAQSGPKHGLVMIANIQQDEYVDQVGDVAGARIVVLPQNQIAFPEDDGITVSPGHATSIGMLQTTVERQPKPFGICTGNFDDEQRSVYSEKYQIEYNKNACLKTCYQRYVIQRCGCADPYVPSYGKAFLYITVPVCSTSNITQDDCKYEVIRQYANNTLVCDCPDRCSDKLFDLISSMAAFPAKTTKDTLRRRLESKIGSALSDKEIRENIAKLEIFYDSFITKDISETPRYPLVNLFSDIGGVVGLWFGFAFMTFLEIFEFFTDLFVLLIEKLCKSARNQNANKKATRSSADNMSEERID